MGDHRDSEFDFNTFSHNFSMMKSASKNLVSIYGRELSHRGFTINQNNGFNFPRNEINPLLAAEEGRNFDFVIPNAILFILVGFGIESFGGALRSCAHDFRNTERYD